MRRPDWTVIWNGQSWQALPLIDAPARLVPMHERHAVRIAEKLNADPVDSTLRDFGPEGHRV